MKVLLLFGVLAAISFGEIHALSSVDCRVVRCAPKVKEDCTKDEIFVNGDGINYCCDTCVPKVTINREISSHLRVMFYQNYFYTSL